MLISLNQTRNSENFNDSLNRIERANGTDRTVTSARNIENVCDTIRACTDVATFNKNVKRNVGYLDADTDTTNLETALVGVHLDNSLRSARNAVSALANQCNVSVRDNGALATYKVARNHYQAQRLRNETLAKHAFDQIEAECCSENPVNNAAYSAAVLGSFAAIGDGIRFNLVTKKTPNKDIRKALKAIGFTASTTSRIMYCDMDGRSFDEIAAEVVTVLRAEKSKEDRELRSEIRALDRVRATLANNR